jgi:hypothetical protein
MFFLKLLGACFVSLILFMPEFLPKDAYAACCACNQCSRGCTCGCKCGDENGKLACIVNIDKQNNIVRFKDKANPDATFELPYDDELFDKRKVGDCGMIKTQKFDVQVCTGFEKEPGAGSSSGQ